MNSCVSAIHLVSGQQWLDLAKLVLGSFAIISIIIAYLGYKSNIKKVNDDRIRETDKELLAQAKQSLKWAYDVLTEEGHRVPPPADRLNWLTCARHLVRVKDISSQLSGVTYKTVYSEIEEYWRHKFYTAIDHECLRNREYFEDVSEVEWPENIEITSAAVIIDFATWNRTAVDPLDSVRRDDLLKAANGLRSAAAGRGLESYFVHFEEIKAQRRRNEGESV